MAEKEYIEREAVIDLLHYHTDETCSAVVADFEAIPSADVVEVVRCKDCRLRDTEGCPFMVWDCGELMGETNDTDFCSMGQRKEQT